MSKADEAQLANVRALDAWAGAEMGRSWECVHSPGRWSAVGWKSGEEQWLAIGTSPESARAEAQQHLGEHRAQAHKRRAG